MTRLERIGAYLAAAGADALVVTTRSGVLYTTGSRTDAYVLVTAKGDGICLTDSRFTELMTLDVSDTPLIVREVGGKDFAAALAAAVAQLGVGTLAFEGDSLSLRDYQMLQGLPVELIDLKTGLSPLRRQKDPEEIRRLTEAQRVTDAAFDDILNFIKKGVADVEIAARLNYAMGRLGDEGGFCNVLVGPAASMPHGDAKQVPVEDGMFVLMDYGARIGGYVSDMSRTVAVGFATDEMRAAYDAVLQSHYLSYQLMRPGARGADVHFAAQAPIHDAGYGDYVFRHALGHGVGIDIHEAPRASAYAAYANDVFAVGDVCTTEPGIYVPGSFGVRIEDVLIIEAQETVSIAKSPKDLIVL